MTCPDPGILTDPGMGKKMNVRTYRSPVLALAAALVMAIAPATFAASEKTGNMAKPVPIPMVKPTPPTTTATALQTKPVNASTPVNSPRGGEIWGYHGATGPAHWSDIKPAFKTCMTGTRQSPLNLQVADAARLVPLRFHYKVSLIELVNTDHTVRANYGPGSHIMIGPDRYDLQQFHFRTPSEHQVAGRRFPMEIQFVHRHKSGKLAYVSVLVAPGTENLAARELWTRLPNTPNSRSAESRAVLNARDLMPSEPAYFRYSGSLTTPPCTESVQWIVLEEPVLFSAKQIAQLRRITGANARPVQARHGRYLLQADGG